MPKDSSKLRQIICNLFPDLLIDGVAKESGQRVVYYCHFDGMGLAMDSEMPWSSWGSVVMKICTGIDTTTIAYMQMEIETLNSLDSPFYPRLYWNDVFTEDPTTDEKLPERLFISIESYIESIPLSQCSGQFNTEATVARLLLGLIDAASLLWLHKRRLVHRDLKPDNILIRPSGEPVIIDLGILRETGSKGVTLTNFWGPMTILYASPEQVNYDKRAISFKTDIFSLATIVYELLTGNNPYVTDPSNNVHEICQNIATIEPIALDQIGVASIEFAQIIKKMMEKQPYKRYRDIDVLRNDLLAVLMRHK